MAVHDPRRILVLGPAWRIACTVLNIVPLPGLGAVIAGWKNPHTRLRRDGALQMALVLFGSWPLIVPGVAGLVWACWSAYRIQRDARPAPAWSRPIGPPPEGDTGASARRNGLPGIGWLRRAWPAGRGKRRPAGGRQADRHADGHPDRHAENPRRRQP